MANVVEKNKECTECGISKVICGREECKPRHFYGPIIRDHYLIHYVESGKGRFEINKKVYNIKAGEIFYIVPNVMAYYEADKEEPWVYKWIGIKGRHIESVFKTVGLSEKNPVLAVGKEVSDSLDRVVAESEEGEDSGFRFLSAAYDFLGALVGNNHLPTTKKTNDQQYVEKAMDYIWRYIYKKVTVSELAAYVNIDRSYLAGIFKKNTGLSPQQYIMEIKLKTACEYLKSTDYDITRIAQSVGYDDLFVFSHAFKKFIGKSPKKYREEK